MVQSVGTDALLTCLVHAFPPAQLRWVHTSRSDEPLQTAASEKYRVHNWTVDEYSILYGLRISSITWSDYGTYYCIARNEIGSDRAQILINGNISHCWSTSQKVDRCFFDPRVAFNCISVIKKLRVALRGNPSQRYGASLPYGITQCYLPPDTSERAPS